MTIQLEQSILGGLFLSQPARELLLAELTPDLFSNNAHRIIAGKMIELHQAGKEVDILTVNEALTTTERKQARGASYIAGLSDKCASIVNLGEYIDRLRTEARNREIIRAAKLIAVTGEEGELDPGFALQEIQRAAESFGAAEDLEHVSKSAVEVDRQYRAAQGGDLYGLKTGFQDIDDYLISLNPGDFVLLAARPGMGKTALALCIADRVSSREPVIFFSLEMSNVQLARRLLQINGNLDNYRLRLGKLHHDETERYVSAHKDLEGRRLWIDYKPGATLGHIMSQARRCRRRNGLGLVVIDYLGLMRLSRAELRLVDKGDTARTTHISKSIKEMAGVLKVPILALHQLNREVDKRPNKRPMLSDLRDSGSLEQDADVVAFLYRENQYNSNAPAHEAELGFRKNRNGRTGGINLHWQGQYTKFDDFKGNE